MTGYDFGGVFGAVLAHSPTVIFVISVVFITGLWLEDCTGQDWFQRTGAVVTIVSLFTARRTYLTRRVQDNASAYIETLEQGLDRWPQDKLILMLRMGLVDKQYFDSKPSDEEINSKFDFEWGRIKETERKLNERFLDGINRTTLFSAGVGTLVWAFGDLVAQPIVDMTVSACSA